MKKLPEGWEEVELGSIFNFQKKTGVKAGEGQEQGKYKFFTSSSVQSKFIDDYKFNGEYLIFGTGGEASVHHCNEKFSATTDCFVVSIKSTILTRYVYYYLLANIHLLQAGFKGAGLEHISKSYIQKIKIMYPKSKETQKQIISILEKAEKAKEWRKEADELTDNYLKSVFVEMFGDPIRNTKKWPLKKFEEVIRLRRGFDLPVQDRTAGKYPLLASNGVIDYISEFKVIGPGVVTGRSGTIGKVNYVEENYWPLNTTLYSEDLHGNKTMYLLYFLQIYNLERFVRGTGVPTLNRNLFHNEMIIYPPLPLQQKFASIVKEVEQMKEQQKHSKEQIDNLFNALMQKAFKGELVR